MSSELLAPNAVPDDCCEVEGRDTFIPGSGWSVTSAGQNSTSPKTSGFRGKIPALRKPLTVEAGP